MKLKVNLYRLFSFQENIAQQSGTPIESQKELLTQALGTPEHAGRVRGVGKGVGKTSYFGRTTSRRDIHATCNAKYLTLENKVDELTRFIQEKVQGNEPPTPATPITTGGAPIVGSGFPAQFHIPEVGINIFVIFKQLIYYVVFIIC